MGFCVSFFVARLTATTHSNPSNLTKSSIRMARVFNGNFDFEHELASAGYNRSKQIERLHAEMTAHLLALADAGDWLFYPCPAPVEFFSDAISDGFPEVGFVEHGDQFPCRAELVPWGWSNQAVELAAAHNLNRRNPEVECVTRVNSRQFSFDLELELNSEIVGSAMIDSVGRFRAAVTKAAKVWNVPASEFDWLLKAEFGMSGRERISGTGDDLNDSQRNWMERRLDSGEILFFEPRVKPLCELSTQWQIAKPVSGDDQSSDPELVGATQLVVDDAGQYVGSILVDHSSPAFWEIECCDISLEPGLFDQVLNAAQTVVRRAQVMGYHGPIGVDSMVYYGPDDGPELRSVQDVNARYTMGRIALEWFRKFAESNRPAWLLVPPRWLSNSGNPASLRNPIGRQTSPSVINGQPVRRVGVLVDDQAEWQQLLSTNLGP